RIFAARLRAIGSEHQYQCRLMPARRRHRVTPRYDDGFLGSHYLTRRSMIRLMAGSAVGMSALLAACGDDDDDDDEPAADEDGAADPTDTAADGGGADATPEATEPEAEETEPAEDGEDEATEPADEDGADGEAVQ